MLCKYLGFALIFTASLTVDRTSYLSPTALGYCLRVPSYGDTWPTFAPARSTMYGRTKSMKANIARTRMRLQTLNLSYDVASYLHGARFLYTKHIRCLLNADKYNKHTATILRMENVQRDKTRLPDDLSIGQQWLCNVNTQAFGRNTTLKHAEPSRMDKVSWQPLLLALIKIRSSFKPRHTNPLSSSLDEYTSSRASRQGF